jgi:ornithine carbamoyltransferase
LEAARLLDFELRIACPEGYEPDSGLLVAATDRSTVMRDPREAVEGAHIIATDVWTSMGQEEEQERRRALFAPYQVNEALMARAAADALFLHCLPAHRGEEVTDAVIDGPHSVVWDEAENRLHVQKALLELLILGEIPASAPDA